MREVSPLGDPFGVAESLNLARVETQAGCHRATQLHIQAMIPQVRGSCGPSACSV